MYTIMTVGSLLQTGLQYPEKSCGSLQIDPECPCHNEHDIHTRWSIVRDQQLIQDTQKISMTL